MANMLKEAGIPVPQYKDKTEDLYRQAIGTDKGMLVAQADGSDESFGATTDAASTAGGAGTAQAKLRRLTTDIAALLTAFNAEDFASQTTLAAILAKLSADPATQTTLAALLTAFNAEDFASQTTLAAILAKLSADPATQTTLAALLTAFNAEDFASQTTLSALKTSVDGLKASFDTLATLITSGNMVAKKVEQALPEGNNQIGHVGAFRGMQDNVSAVGELLNALPKKPLNRRIISDAREVQQGTTSLLLTTSRIVIHDLRIFVSTGAGVTLSCRVPNVTGEATDINAVRKPVDAYTFTTSISVPELAVPTTYKFVPWFTATSEGTSSAPHIISLKSNLVPLELPHGISLSIYKNSSMFIAFIADIEEVEM